MVFQYIFSNIDFNSNFKVFYKNLLSYCLNSCISINSIILEIFLSSVINIKKLDHCKCQFVNI